MTDDIPVRAQSADTTEPRVCSKCGTAGCLEDAESGWYDDTPALAAPGVDTAAPDDGEDFHGCDEDCDLFRKAMCTWFDRLHDLVADALPPGRPGSPSQIFAAIRAALAARTPQTAENCGLGHDTTRISCEAAAELVRLRDEADHWHNLRERLHTEIRAIVGDTPREERSEDADADLIESVRAVFGQSS